MKKKITHIIPDQKFTLGYMNFMTNKMAEDFEHLFIVVMEGKEPKFELPDKKAINYVCIERTEQLSREPIFKFLADANKIIVSGLFNRMDIGLIRLPKKILRKVYLHFWGGDFYNYRITNFFSKKYIHKKILYRCIKRCAGIITLIPGDYEELSKIFPNEKPHFVASMPEDSERRDDYEKYLNNEVRTNKILVGNSATRENHHLEAFNLLEHLRDKDIKIICPLSYGDSAYAREVAETGKEIFGAKFVPLFKYQNFEQYKHTIADCSVGIFANDRQQAMGNIAMMIKMGKKLYLRKGTSMWNDYKNHDLIIYPLDNLANESVNEVFSYDKEKAIRNDKKLRERDIEYTNNWSIILNI